MIERYGCQKFTHEYLCRYDRRAADRKCDGCPRTTDAEFLKSMGLWVEGISHPRAVEDWSAEAMARFSAAFSGHGEK